MTFPDVDRHPVAELRELVDERDVHRAEKCFSSSFVSSAASGVETSTIVSIALRYTSAACFVHSA